MQGQKRKIHLAEFTHKKKTCTVVNKIQLKILHQVRSDAMSITCFRIKEKLLEIGVHAFFIKLAHVGIQIELPAAGSAELCLDQDQLIDKFYQNLLNRQILAPHVVEVTMPHKIPFRMTTTPYRLLTYQDVPGTILFPDTTMTHSLREALSQAQIRADGTAALHQPSPYEVEEYIKIFYRRLNNVNYYLQQQRRMYANKSFREGIKQVPVFFGPAGTAAAVPPVMRSTPDALVIDVARAAATVAANAAVAAAAAATAAADVLLLLCTRQAL